jgi:peptidoglycan L-alanyl-D-glutamate endopeptidase CwlK
MTTALSVQQRLHALALYNGALDGEIGPQTLAAMSAALDKLGAKAAPTLPPVAANGKFDAGSAKRLKDAHPLLQKLMNAAREKVVFSVLDSQRGRAAQELAFQRGNSKAHFGQSAHNWSPSVAVDIVPAATPNAVDWNDLPAFKNLGKIIMPLAKEMGIPIRWLGDPNMDGSPADGWDFPHFELHPWREFAKSSKPFKG